LQYKTIAGIVNFMILHTGLVKMNYKQEKLLLEPQDNGDQNTSEQVIDGELLPLNDGKIEGNLLNILTKRMPVKPKQTTQTLAEQNAAVEKLFFPPDEEIEANANEIFSEARAANIPQDFFMADLSNFSFKGDTASMECPIFALSTKEESKLWVWESIDGKKKVAVAPGYYGRATQHDKDVLLYCASQLIQGMKNGQVPNQKVRFVVYDYLKTVGGADKKIGGDNYKRLKQSLDRLQGVQIKTNVVTGGGNTTKSFGILSGWTIVEKNGAGQMVAVEVELGDWVYRSIVSGEVLTINPAYFKLRKALTRRLYEVARKHCGNQAGWRISLKNLQDKCGSTTAVLSDFKKSLISIIEDDNLPDYRFVLEDDGNVLFYQRDLERLSKGINKL
jgi:hypothetical protein